MSLIKFCLLQFSKHSDLTLWLNDMFLFPNSFALKQILLEAKCCTMQVFSVIFLKLPEPKLSEGNSCSSCFKKHLDQVRKDFAISLNLNHLSQSQGEKRKISSRSIFYFNPEISLDTSCRLKPQNVMFFLYSKNKMVVKIYSKY